MKTARALALLALAVGCHLDKLFTSGGGNARLSRGAPVGLAFRAEPAPAQAGQPLDPIRVAVVDSAGTPVAGADSLITIALANPGSATLSGTDTTHAVNGVATFSDLRIDQPGSGYMLEASAGSFPPKRSAPFDVMPAPTTTGDLTVTTSTSGPNIDPDGYTVTVDGAASRAIGTGASVTFPGLTATTHAVALSGVASNCTVTESNPQSVNVPAGGTAQASFTVICTPPLPSGNHLEFTDLPRTMQAGQVMPPVRITVYDASGGQVRDFTGDITVSIGANPGSGTLAGTKVVPMHPSLGGVGEWLDLSIDRAGNGYTLRATAAGVGSATSDPFDITTNPPPPLAGATGLGFLDQPTTTRAGGTIPPFRVVATDDAGNIATGFGGAIWITLASNPGGATLSGTRRLVAVNGMVTFSDLSIDRPGSGYTVHVSYWPLRFKNSTAFDITP
jgi:hypothetical protein